MRERLIVMSICAFALAGCTAGIPVPPPPPLDTRMPVIVDYRAHLTKHPPFKHSQGKVDPVDHRPTAVHEYGPESRADPVRGPGGLLAELDAFRAREPHGSATLLALAKRKARKARTAKADDDQAIEDGEGGREAALAPDAVKNQDGGYRLNFEDAEVKDVLQAVLGNVLHLSYTLAPNVTGRITISSSAPQNRTELLSTLETVLAMQGLSMTRTGSAYRIAAAAVGGGSIDENGQEPGFGISVVPLEFTSGSSMMKLLAGFITDADGVRVDTARNAMIIRGPGPRREEIVRAVKNFDADWMHSQAVSVVELRRSHPEEIIGELTRIFDSDINGGNAAGTIQFKAIKRLRSIMVISRNPQLVKRANSWIRRLDHQDTSSTESIFVYRPRYRDARELVRLVNGLFSGGGNSGSGDSSVAFQGGQQGQTGASQPGGAGSSPAGQQIGLSNSSFAGGLSTGGLTAGNNPGGGAGSGLGTLPGSSFSPTGAGPGSTGNGLTGNLADPIEAGQGGANANHGKMSLTADTSNNTIVAYTDGETYAKMSSVLRQLDIPPLQVSVNVIIAEVQLNDELKYGVQFYLNNKAGSIGLTQTATQALSTITSSAAVPGFNFLLGGASSANVILSALDAVSKVHILSTPSIVVMENKPATFEVGNQVPVITQQATSTLTAGAPTLNQVTYLDTGIILKIIPRVGQNGMVAMDLDQVISSVVPDSSGSTQSLTPTISKRRIASDISVRSGQNVLLAGLVNDNRSQSKGQVPFIGPDLGNIFGNRDNAFNRTELVVFIRPVIIRDGQDAQSVAEEFRGHLKAMNLDAGPAYKP